MEPSLTIASLYDVYAEECYAEKNTVCRVGLFFILLVSPLFHLAVKTSLIDQNFAAPTTEYTARWWKTQYMILVFHAEQQQRSESLTAFKKLIY